MKYEKTCVINLVVFSDPRLICSVGSGSRAGMAANMLCANQNLDPVTVRDLMRKSCIKNLLYLSEFGPYTNGISVDWPDYGWHERYGYGLLVSSFCHDLAVAQLDEPY
ncbi:MAG: hypothetical protein FK733_18060 [Asgard group archaeon]|nr:hypothetical protein [Asgard group archaeon]